MASTFSNLGIELIGTGDQAGSWGATTNNNLGTLIDQAISGYVTQAVTTGGLIALSIPDGTSSTGRNMYIKFTGTGGANTVVTLPTGKTKVFFAQNASTGSITIKSTAAGSTGITLTASTKALLMTDGSEVYFAANNVVPSNGIVLWNGSAGSPPSGWATCNGLNGTPNLPTVSGYSYIMKL